MNQAEFRDSVIISNNDMGKRIRPCDEVVQKNIKEWGIPQPDRDYTVVIHCSTYNHGKYIRDALEGFVSQKCSYSFCAIVIDDGSTDNAPEIIREYAEEYPEIIKPILLGENHMQRGILRDPYFEKWHKCAKYLAQCEGDDYWIDSSKLQKQVDFLESHEDFTMCFHGSDIRNESCREVWIHCDTIETREYYVDDVFPTWVPHTSSFLYRREIVGSFQMKHPEWLESGDTMLVLKCMHLGRVWGMEEHMSVYRMNDHSLMSHTNDVKAIGRYALHLKCFLLNFPKIDKEYCYYEICSYDYERFKKNDGERNRWYYWLDAMRTSPRFMWQLYKRQLKAILKKFI